MEWCDRSFLVSMPNMVPGQLSEVELLKMFAEFQWLAIAKILQKPCADICNDRGERLYGSVINFETCFATKTPMDFGEGTEVQVRQAARFHAQRFVEGFFCFDGGAIPASVPDSIRGREDLERLEVPWVYLTMAFVTREESNLRLKTFAPVGAAYGKDFMAEVVPPGIRDHESVERTGQLGISGIEQATPMANRGSDEIVYDVVPESDLNGAGLLYFARYVAIANYGERLFLRRCSQVEVSSRLTRLLTTRRRRVFYFANAAEEDSVRVRVGAFVSRGEDGASASPHNAVPLKFYFVTELRRQSDGTLMAKSVAEKHLVIARRLKSLMLEAGRIGQECGLRGA